jgi:hypothetical protein
MMRNRLTRLPVASVPLVLLALFALLLGGWAGNGVECPPPEDEDSELTSFTIRLWKNGHIPYKFSKDMAVALSSLDQVIVREMMDEWEDAFNLEDPATSGHFIKYIEFQECTKDCPETGYLLIRYNYTDTDRLETNNMCEFVCNDEWWCDERRGQIGWLPGSVVTLHLNRPGGTLNDNTVLHELGHCLGMWHEQNRADRDASLMEEAGFSYDYDGKNGPDPIRSQNMPILGNYDYDSVMHYASYTDCGGTCGDRRHRDLWGNAFSRWELDPYLRTGTGKAISPGLRSRLLQYYAHDYQANWGFFESLSLPRPVAGTDTPRNSYLEISQGLGIPAVGTPAIAFQSPGNYDIFARGTNNHLYWMTIRGISRSDWTSLGCCFGSDPSAVSRRNGEIDLVAIGAETGRPVYNRYADEAWGGWVYIRDNDPPQGIKQRQDGDYIGPAIASRTAATLDVFVVQGDGLLAVTTFDDGAGGWTRWSTLGTGYNVTARPAAVALAPTRVQLAVNESDTFLYEGAATFVPRLPSWAPLSGSFDLVRTAVVAYQAPPALTARDDPDNPYRVLITNADGRISHRFASGTWRDIGGIPKPGSGPSAVATGRFGALIVINGDDTTGCDLTCIPGHAPMPNGEFIQPGGLWLREFE